MRGWRRWAAILGAAAFFFSCSGYVRRIDELPQRIVLTERSEVKLDVPHGVGLREEDAVCAEWSSDETLGTVVQAKETGTADASYTLFGVVPVKRAAVEVVAPRNVYAGGEILGIALLTDGALVVGTGSVLDDRGFWQTPAENAGLEEGDLIVAIDGESVENAAFLSEHLSEIAETGVELTVLRDGERQNIRLIPVREAGSELLRLGVWVRDSTAGVGTLTYADGSRGTYGALGHGILDADTGRYLTVRQGVITPASVIDVVRGERGEPGQLVGSYTLEARAEGSIVRNNEFGIFGQWFSDDLPDIVLPVGTRSQVRRGEAQILSAVSGEVRAYTCEIERITPQRSAQNKSMVLRVTDEELLQRTGGIVQGMSGSPIVQDGMLVGAVTHVFVNDPTRGYGVFLDWMLTESDAL